MDGNEIDEAEPLDVLDRAVGAAARSAYDAAYVTALKTARSLLASTNAEVALHALADMIAVFDPTDRAPDDLAEPGLARPRNDEPPHSPSGWPGTDQ